MKRILAAVVFLVGLRTVSAAGFNLSNHDSNHDPAFAPNAQAASPVKFLFRQGPLVAQFADHSMTLGTRDSRVRVEFVGADSQSTVSLAVDSSGNTLVYRGTWPGIETQYATYRKTFKSEYHVAPGADPNLIRLRYDSQTAPRVLGDGSLSIGMPGAAFVESAPYAYQGRETRVRVEAAYRTNGDGTVGFTLGPYDPSIPLVIDPVMNYSTFFGGSGNTTVTAIALDSFGNAIVVGWTTARDLPAHGARTTFGGSVDAFVAKISAEGNRIVWCSYLGGSGDDRAFGVAVDASNSIYVTGWTQSTNFPVVGAIQTKLSGGRDAFVAKLNSSGTAIVYSTYLGGTNYEQGNSIAVDSTGAAYITGDTMSTNFPVLNAYQSIYGGGTQDAFVAKLNPTGGMVFSSYFGGSGADHGAAIALDASNNVYIAGSTYSTNMHVSGNATQPKIGGGQDAFVGELNAAGITLLFGTFIGGSNGTPGLVESANAVAVDVSGNLYVAGSTSSINFPTTASAFQPTLEYGGGAEDHGFAWKINSAKSQIIYSTYLQGMNVDTVGGMAVDPAGNAYIVGATSSIDFPNVRAFQTAISGVTSAYLLKLNPTGSGLIFGSYLGGSSSDAGNCVALDSRQNIVIGGLAQSSDFPLSNAAQSYNNGQYSGFVTRVVSGWYPIAFQNGNWFLDIWHDGGYDGSLATFSYANFGQTGDVPIVGDWTNSGSTKIGIFRNGLWILDSNANGQVDATDRQFTFGQAGDIPIVGDWNGTGSTKAGLVRNGVFILDLSGHMSGVPTGKPDLSFAFGLTTDVPVVGDWGSTGVTKVGVYRNGEWLLDTQNAHTLVPADEIVYYGIAGDTPVVGDWDGSGTLKLGFVIGGAWFLNISGSNQYAPGMDTQFYYGNSSMQFLVGH